MHHHRHREVVEHSGVEQQDFAAAELFGGGAQQRHPQTQLVGNVGERECGAHAAAAMMLWPQA